MYIELPDNTLGHNLTVLRRKYKLSQTALAKLVGISVYTLRGWESGNIPTVFSLKTLHRICAVFDTTVELLLNEKME